MIEIKDLKPYMVEFKEGSKIKLKIYLLDCVIAGNNWQPIIVITYNEYTFSANNSIKRA